MYLINRLRKLLWTRHSNQIFDTFNSISNALKRSNAELQKVANKNTSLIAILDQENAEIAQTTARNEKLVEKIADMLK